MRIKKSYFKIKKQVDDKIACGLDEGFLSFVYSLPTVHSLFYERDRRSKITLTEYNTLYFIFIV